MSKFSKIILAGLILLVALGIYFLLIKSTASKINSPSNQVQTAVKNTAQLDIHYGDNKADDIFKSIPISPNETALDFTQGLTTLKTTGQGSSAFITSVNGVSADSVKSQFWELLINGKPSNVGAGSYIVKNGDKLEWKISTYRNEPGF